MTDLPAATYRTLVDQRRRRGQQLHGNRHLREGGQLKRATAEIADTRVYIELERDRLIHQRTITAGQLQTLNRLLKQTTRVGERTAAAAREVCDPAVQFADLLSERSAYGERKFGDAYLARDNLTEALEELADAQIFISLQADRLRHRDQYTPDIQQLLIDTDDQTETLAIAVATTRAELAAVNHRAAA